MRRRMRRNVFEAYYLIYIRYLTCLRIGMRAEFSISEGRVKKRKTEVALSTDRIRYLTDEGKIPHYMGHCTEDKSAQNDDRNCPE